MIGEGTSSLTVLIRNRWPSERDQVFLSVGEWQRAADARGKERNRGAGLDRLGVRNLDGNRHEPAIERDVEQFLAVATPAHLTRPRSPR